MQHYILNGKEVEKASPLLFETLIFGGEHDGDMWRYSTWDEAKAGHGHVVTSMTPAKTKHE